MSDSARLALPVVMSGEAKRQSSFFKSPLTAFASVLSGYFILAAGSLYWLVAAAGALGAQVFPRTLIKRQPLAWLIVSTGLTATLTQTVQGFFRDYPNPAKFSWKSACGFLLDYWPVPTSSTPSTPTPSTGSQ